MSDPITRAQDAQRLLDDPIFNEAFAAVDKALIEQLKTATPQDAELLMAWRLLPKIRGWLIGQVQSGKVELQLREQEQRKKK